jgi:uncharacterized membrane protein YphA (DoxX/SURF4 family)
MKTITKGMNVTLWVTSVLAAAVFLVAGGAKLSGAMNEEFLAWGYSRDFAMGIGVIEVLCAVGLLFKRIAGWAALALMAVMGGAIWVYAIHAEYLMLIAPIVMFLLLGFIVWGRGLHWTAQRSTEPHHPSPSPS